MGTVILSSEDLPGVSYFLDGTEINFNSETTLPVGGYELMAVSDDLCETVVLLEIVEAESVELNIDGPSSLLFGGSGDYNVTLFPANNIQSTQWFFNDSLIQGDIADFSFSSSGELCATVEYNDGCIVSSCIPIVISNPSVYIPNIISLSSSSGNDVFRVFSAVDANLEYIRIYDRWGNLIFNRENLPISSPDLNWNGSFNEESVVAGVYVYDCFITFATGEQEKFMGDITVME